MGSKLIIGLLLALALITSSPTNSRAGTTAAADACQKGETAVKQQRYSNAIVSFDEALRLDPKLAKAYLGRANCERLLNKNFSAVDDYSQYLLLVPKDESAYFSASDCYLKMGKKNAALSFLSKVITLNPRSAQAYAKRAQLYQDLHQKELAEQDRDVAAKLDQAEKAPNQAASK